MARPDDMKSAYEVAAWQIRILLLLRIGLISVFLAIVAGIGRLMWDAYIGNPELIYDATIRSNRIWLSYVGLAGVYLVLLVDRSLQRSYYITLGWAADLEVTSGFYDGLYRRMRVAQGVITGANLEALTLVYAHGFFLFVAFIIVEFLFLLLT